MSYDLPMGGGDGEMMDLIPDGMIIRSMEGVVRAWNKGAERLYGWTAEQAIGQPLDALLQSNHPFGLGYLGDALSRQGHWQGEIYRRTADDRAICVRVRWAARHDAQGGITEIVEWSRDTESSAGEIAAHRYTNLFHAMAASFWELDFSEVRKAIGQLVASGVDDLPAYLRSNTAFIDRAIRMVRVIDVNEQTLSLYRIPSREAVLAQPMDWTWPAESRHVFAESLIAAAQRQDSYSVETVLKRWDGEPFEVLFTVCWPSDHKAQGTVLVGIVDITDRKRAERELHASARRYRDLFHHVPVALLQLDMRPLFARLEQLRSSGIVDLADHVENTPAFLDEVLSLPRIEEANAEALRLFRVETVTPLLGPIGWAWRDRPETIRRSLIARLRGAPYYSEETRVSRPDGSLVDALYVMSFPKALMDHGINVVGFIDISARKAADMALGRAEARLREVQTNLSHAARVSTLGELTASIAHEVNQPLAAITAFGEASLRWLQRTQPDVAEAESLTREIIADARRASDIIARIRGMALKRDPRPLPLDIAEVIEEAMLIIRHESQIKGVTIRTDIGAALPAVIADKVQLQQVIVNLAVNALQAMAKMPPDQRTLAIRARQAQSLIEVEIDDTGPGIAPDHLDQLFNGFFTTREDGMGMGLAICRSIIQEHGGHITADNHDAGARFRFSLPARVDADS